ncbi:MAG: endonuclease V [Planctomycetaceae bacterium]
MSNLPVPIPDLPAALQALLRQIPAGRVSTYGDLARALGSASAARWVGTYLADHPHDAHCTCHRVVRQTGDLGGYVSGRTADKRRRLRAEGVPVESDRVDLPRLRFTDFEMPPPLAPLIALQDSLPQRNTFPAWTTVPDRVAGVDLSYLPDDRAVAAYALVETASGELLWPATVTRPVRFPYIPGLLAFRELPVLLDLLDEVRSHDRLAEVVLVDGHGILHPRRAGIATNLGITAGVPTIGVSKALLCGRVDRDAVTPHDPQPVIVDEEVLGMAMKATARSRPIIVSPGHGIDVASAVEITRRLFHGHRLPEPIWQADALSRREARRRGLLNQEGMM